MKNIKIAVVPGHSILNQNFTLYTGETEWSFGYRFCEYAESYMHENFANLEVRIFFRDGSLPYKAAMKKLAKEIAAWGADVVVEHHMNAYEKVARGCEALVHYQRPVTAIILDRLTDNFSKEFGILERKNWKIDNQHTDGILRTSKGQAGYWNLHYYRKYGIEHAFIWEPCFANFKHEDSTAVLADDARYFTFMSKQIGLQFGGVLKTVIPLPAPIQSDSELLADNARLAQKVAELSEAFKQQTELVSTYSKKINSVRELVRVI